MKDKTYIAIDLKSFYASVECAERGLDPLDANLVVADESRTDKTICLAVSPALKSHGISGRARLFEAKQRIKEVNRERQRKAPGHKFRGKSIFGSELAADPSLELDLVVAPPRMAYYMEYSKDIVGIYMRYVSMDDILVYSIDEVFIDATPYLSTYNMTAHDFAMMLIQEVLKETRITATAGIGSNMYLAKIAMDIVAKHIPADKDGVRIAELNEMNYREKLWTHKPLTDFWRVGKGIARKLEQNGMFTMGDIARCSEGKDTDYYNEDLLYNLFGVNAELLIDHAWGWEPAEIADCKAYKPESKSLSSGQVLSRPYSFDEGRIVLLEMADLLSMDLVRAGLFTDQVVLNVGYDIENLTDPKRAAKYKGAITTDFYGRQVPKSAHGSKNLGLQTSSTAKIMDAVGALYDSIGVYLALVCLEGLRGYAAQFPIDFFGNLPQPVIDIIAGAGFIGVIPMNREVAAIQMVHAGVFVRRPHQFLDAVAPANVRTQLNEGLPHIGVNGVGVESIACALNGNGPVIVCSAAGAPGAVAFVHNGAYAAIGAYAIVAAGPQPRIAEMRTQGLHPHLPHHTMDGDGVDFHTALLPLISRES